MSVNRPVNELAVPLKTLWPCQSGDCVSEQKVLLLSSEPSAALLAKEEAEMRRVNHQHTKLSELLAV